MGMRSRAKTPSNPQDSALNGSTYGSRALSSKVVITFLFTAFVLQPLVMYYFLLTNTFYAFSYWIPILILSEIASMTRAPLTSKELYVLLTLQPIAFSNALLFINILKNMYFAYSEPSKFFGIAYHIPSWWVPPEPVATRLYESKFVLLEPAWIQPLVITIVFLVFTIIIDLTLGYLSYLVLAVEERLEFPFARLGVAMVTTLAEREPTMLRVIFTSCVVGILLNLSLKFLPYLLNVFLLGGTFIIALPFYGTDFTPYLDYILPGAAFLLVYEPLAYISGILLPPIVAVTQFLASFCLYFIGSHIITRFDLWPFESKWVTGWGYWTLHFRSNLYFYVSLQIGMSLAAMLLPILANPKPFVRTLAALKSKKAKTDVPLHFLLLLFIISSIAYCLLAWYLTSFMFPIYVLFLLIMGGTFFSTYIATASAGVTFFGTNVPYLRELVIYVSGYRRKDIWFVPLPATLSTAPVGTAAATLASPLGGSSIAQSLFQADLIGVRHKEFIYAYFILVGVTLISSFIFTNTFWHVSPIPSHAYPYTVTGWYFDAFNWARMMVWIWTGYLFRFVWIAIGFVVGAVIFGLSNFLLKSPYLLVVALTGAGMGIPWAFAQMIGSIVFRKVLRGILGDKWGAYSYLIVSGIFLGDAIMETVRILMIILARAQWLLPF